MTNSNNNRTKQEIREDIFKIIRTELDKSSIDNPLYPQIRGILDTILSWSADGVDRYIESVAADNDEMKERQMNEYADEIADVLDQMKDIADSFPSDSDSIGDVVSFLNDHSPPDVRDALTSLKNLRKLFS